MSAPGRRSSSPSRPGGGTGEERPSETRRARIRRATEGGGLDELPDGFSDPENGDWRVVASDDPFEQLYLDHRQEENITASIVRRHYELIADFWKKKVRTLDSGVEQQARQIRRKYGREYVSAERVREHLEQTTRAYGLLSDADGGAACHRELHLAHEERGREVLLPVLQPPLRRSAKRAFAPAATTARR